MGKHIESKQLSETLTLSECTDGYWLYDTTRGMNLAMRAKTADAAYLETIEYYQRRLIEVETNLKTLEGKVDSFLSQFKDEN